jgi:probable F420-dependent oxidoreductase
MPEERSEQSGSAAPTGSSTPSVGIIFANIAGLGTAEGAAALAEACDRHGVESVWTVKHVVVPAGYQSTYPYRRDGRMPGDESAPIPDPLVWLTWVAAHSQHVRLATGVLILPQRNPPVLAKEVATLDRLSGGRVTLGVGVGWLEEEFDALGIPFNERGRRTDEAIEALRALWTEERSTFRGAHHRFEDVLSFPKPVQGSVPIVVGGHSEAAARRAGRLGDGFFPGRHDDLDHLVQTMRSAADAAGRDPDSIELTVGAPRTAEDRQRFLDLGARRFVIPPPAFEPDGLDAAVERAVGQLT